MRYRDYNPGLASQVPASLPKNLQHTPRRRTCSAHRFKPPCDNSRIVDKPEAIRLLPHRPSLGQKDPTLRCLALLHYAFNMEFVMIAFRAQGTR
jgi:hypothetical protein